MPREARGSAMGTEDAVKVLWRKTYQTLSGRHNPPLNERDEQGSNRRQRSDACKSPISRSRDCPLRRVFVIEILARVRCAGPRDRRRRD